MGMASVKREVPEVPWAASLVHRPDDFVVLLGGDVRDIKAMAARAMAVLGSSLDKNRLGNASGFGIPDSEFAGVGKGSGSHGSSPREKVVVALPLLYRYRNSRQGHLGWNRENSQIKRGGAGTEATRANHFTKRQLRRMLLVEDIPCDRYRLDTQQLPGLPDALSVAYDIEGAVHKRISGPSVVDLRSL